jgi:cytochrome c-type biogenesis protein
MELGLAAAFGAGLLSFLSPCILPLVPPYLCFIAGTSLEELTAEAKPAELVGHTLGRAVSFVLGFTAVFTALGASASGVGQMLSDHLTALTRISGIIIVLLGLHISGIVPLRPLMREARFAVLHQPASLLGALAVGLAFGFGWTPCVGPVLASILLLAGAEGTVSRGAALLFSYAAGIGVPFIAAAWFTGYFIRMAARLRSWLPWTNRAMGMLLLATGVLVFAGLMSAVGAWVLERMPALGRIG